VIENGSGVTTWDTRFAAPHRIVSGRAAASATTLPRPAIMTIVQMSAKHAAARRMHRPLFDKALTS
jgi:hypothetical protein